jgi:hypothetical protein
MTSGSTVVFRRAVVRVTSTVSVAAIATALAVAPAAAKQPKQPRVAKAETTVQDVAGLEVVRTWKITPDDTGSLTVTVQVRNPNAAPVTTTILEPLPTDSLKKVKFSPKKVKATETPGLARFDVTVPSSGTTTFGYTALLTKDRKANAQDRLATIQGEMEATLATAQPTDADRALAAVKDRYVGRVKVTEEAADGVTLEEPQLGREFAISLRLTPTPNCRVVSRGCRFTAADSFTDEPKLTALDPFGNALVADGSADLAESGMTCNGVEAPGLMVTHWSFDPTNWRLSWSGWEVIQGNYTIVGDLSSPSNSRCVAAAVHTVLTGLMTG